MKTRMLISIGAIACLIAGCQITPDVQHIVTGQVHPPTQAVFVEVTTSRPTNAVTIATIMVRVVGSGQGACDQAMLAAKEDAAKLGATGFSMGNVKYYPGRSTYLNGWAWYLPDFAR
jgi:hypothetical protein